jgi:hypothetical protein
MIESSYLSGGGNSSHILLFIPQIIPDAYFVPGQQNQTSLWTSSSFHAIASKRSSLSTLDKLIVPHFHFTLCHMTRTLSTLFPTDDYNRDLPVTGAQRLFVALPLASNGLWSRRPVTPILPLQQEEGTHAWEGDAQRRRELGGLPGTE